MMGMLRIDEIISHCDRQLAREPHGSMFYREHEAVKEYLTELQKYKDLEAAGRLAILPEQEKVFAGARRKGWYTNLTGAEVAAVLNAYGSGLLVLKKNTGGREHLPSASYPWTPEGGGGSHGAGSRPVHIASLCDGKLVLIENLPPGSYPIVVGPDHEEGSDV